jgi:hypothetical protein
MDTTEAQKILAEQLARLGSYSELVPLAEGRFSERLEIRGTSGASYEVQLQFFWDDKPKRIVRVVGSIDDGGIRAFFPLTKTLLVSPPESMARTPPTEAPD